MKKQWKWLWLFGVTVLLMVGCSKEEGTQKKEPAKVIEKNEEKPKVDTMIKEEEVLRMYDDKIMELPVGQHIASVDYFVDEVTIKEIKELGVTHNVSVRFVGKGTFHELTLTEKTELLQDVTKALGVDMDGKRMTVCEDGGKETCQFDRLILDENDRHYNMTFSPDAEGKQVLFLGEKEATE